MKVAVKFKGKTELGYIDPHELVIGDTTLGSVLDYMAQVETRLESVLRALNGSSIIRKGDLIALNGELVSVDDVKVFTERPNKPLHFYKVVDGQLVLDKEKVGMILWKF